MRGRILPLPLMQRQSEIPVYGHIESISILILLSLKTRMTLNVGEEKHIKDLNKILKVKLTVKCRLNII